MPTLPKMAVREAKRAERRAQKSQPFPSGLASAGPGALRSSIRRVPASIPTMPKTWAGPKGSPRKRKARAMVRTVLDLSMGTTWFTLPSWRARK